MLYGFLHFSSVICSDNQHAVVPSYWIKGTLKMQQPEHIW